MSYLDNIALAKLKAYQDDIVEEAHKRLSGLL